MADSIIAKLGADKSGFKKVLESTEDDVAASSARMASKESQATSVRLAGVNKIKHNVADLAQTILAGGSATDIFTQAVIRLGSSFKLGLGAAVGAGVFAVLAKQIAELQEHAEKLRDTFNEITAPRRSVENSSLDDLQAQFKKTSDAYDELKDNLQNHPVRSLLESMAEGGKSALGGLGRDFDNQGGAGKAAYVAASPVLAPAAFLGGALNAAVDGGGTKENNEKLDKEHAALQADLDRIAKKELEINQLEQDRLTLGEKAVALKKIETEFNEKNQKLQDMHSHGLDTTNLALQLKNKRDADKDKVEYQANKAAQGADDQNAVLYQQIQGHQQVSSLLAEQLKFHREIQAAQEAGNEKLVESLQAQKDTTLELKAQEIVDANRARHQPSLQEVAKKGGGRAREEARRALREDDLARSAYARGDTKHGDQHASRADRIRKELGSHHVIQKQPDLSDAFDKSQILQTIATALQGIGAT